MFQTKKPLLKTKSRNMNDFKDKPFPTKDLYQIYW